MVGGAVTLAALPMIGFGADGVDAGSIASAGSGATSSSATIMAAGAAVGGLVTYCIFMHEEGQP
eukprot:scaffold9278_cov170-Cylindrotheca_fusiformis.AAC.2